MKQVKKFKASTKKIQQENERYKEGPKGKFETDKYNN